MDKFRYTVISAGRQSGKTTLCLNRIILHALSNKRAIDWWVSPQYAISEIAFLRTIEFLLERKIPFKAKKNPMRIILGNGSRIEFKSADRPDGLRGETVHFLVIDEMGIILREAWEQALRGTIAINKAPVLFIGTPKGRNLFYELFVRGQDPEEKNYCSIQFSSNENPFFPADEWEEVKRLPQRIFEQEYCARFIDSGGEVFRNVEQCIKGSLEAPVPGKRYTAGIDLAKTFDFTVVTIFDENNHLVAFDRFNDISWSIQRGRIETLINKYNAKAYIDSTGVGDPVVEELQKVINCEGVKFKNENKAQMVDALAIAIEDESISYPDIPELTNELSTFTFEQTRTGKIRYSAPSGLHDDIVMSMALANYNVRNTFNMGVMSV